jgi:type I restriction enzyme S subunit
MKIKISDLVNEYGDGIHGTPNYDSNGDYYFINGNNLKDGSIVLDKETKKISKEEFDKIKRPLNNNTVLVSINGTIGSVAFYDGEKYALGKSVCYLNAKDEKSKYLIKYLISTSTFLDYSLKVAHGSTIKNLAPSQVVDFEIDLGAASESELYKIIDILKLFDEKMSNNNAENNEYNSVINITYDKLFNVYNSKNIDKKFKYINEIEKNIPEDWNYMKISEIEKNIITGKTPSTSNANYFNGNIPFITIDDIRKNHFIYETNRSLSKCGAESQKSKYLPKNSICVSCIATVGEVGITTTLSQTNQQINSIVLQNEYNLYYIYLTLIRYFSYSSGAKTGNIFANMNKNDFESIKIVYPSFKILEEFNYIVKPLFEKIKNNLQENITLNKIKKDIWSLYLNGKIRIED